MKLRNFLKTLGVSSVAGLFIRPSINTEAAATLPKFQLVDKPLDPKKDYVYEDDYWRIKAFVTANFLIPVVNKEGKTDYEMNYYGEFWKCLAIVTADHKNCGKALLLRFESPIVMKEDIDKAFDVFIDNVRMNMKACMRQHGKPVTTIPAKITFKA